MANTYTQLYVQIVFAVKGRENLIRKEWKDELYQYITGIVQNNGHKMLRINGMPDHVHVFVGFSPKQSISDLVMKVKSESTNFIKRKKFSRFEFSWQIGYGAFTYGHSQVDAVVKYIINQELHHREITFRKEYLGMLKKSEIEFKGEYLFDFLDDVGDW